MSNARTLTSRPTTYVTLSLGALSIGVITTQIWWRIPVETIGSPEDLLNLALAALLAFLTALVSRSAPLGPSLQRRLKPLSGLLLFLAIGEDIVDAGSFDFLDVPVTVLWLLAGLVPGWVRGISPNHRAPPMLICFRSIAKP